jgi:PAS domain S-box-containing protein
MTELHHLLTRQLRRAGCLATEPSAPQWTDLLTRVDRAYRDHDRDRQLLERSLEISSREMRDYYDELAANSEARLASERGRFEQVFASVTVGLFVIDRGARITVANPEACRLVGPSASIIGRSVPDVLRLVGRTGEPHPLIDRATIEQAFASERWSRSDLRLVGPGGHGEFAADVSIVPLRDHGETVGGLVIVTDASDRAATRAQLEWQATHDPLTGLIGRAEITERIAVALVQARRTGAWPTLLFIDIDRFKHVNDTLGHATGDVLLTSIAQSLQRCVRPGDAVARLGGDEFLVLCEGDATPLTMVDPDDPFAQPPALVDDGTGPSIAKRIIAALSDPFDITGERITVSGSIGIANGGPATTSAEALIHDADLAMYRAKESGRNRFEVADDSLRAAAAERLLLEQSLRSALAHREVGVAYQPIRRTSDDELIGFEALARWVHPLLGVVRPDVFVPVAEESGLIHALGDRMLDLACRDVASWNRERAALDRPPLVVHVNISARDLQSTSLVERVKVALRQHGVPAHWLILEVTETMLLDDPESALERLRELKLAGIRVAIDDFGTGYSSLSYLRRYPVHMVKIDREFITELASSKQDQCIVRAMVDLSRGLDHVVLAEGVETPAELDVLRAIGCDLVQGYLIGRPMPGEDALLVASTPTVGEIARA